MVTTAMHNTEITSGLEDITPGQRKAIFWACRWHADFEYGLTQTTEPRIVDFINDKFDMQINELNDLTKAEATYILTQLSIKKL